jgi:hypothetical protein
LFAGELAAVRLGQFLQHLRGVGDFVRLKDAIVVRVERREDRTRVVESSLRAGALIRTFGVWTRIGGGGVVPGRRGRRRVFLGRGRVFLAEGREAAQPQRDSQNGSVYFIHKLCFDLLCSVF